MIDWLRKIGRRIDLLKIDCEYFVDIGVGIYKTYSYLSNLNNALDRSALAT